MPGQDYTQEGLNQAELSLGTTHPGRTESGRTVPRHESPEEASPRQDCSQAGLS